MNQPCEVCGILETFPTHGFNLCEKCHSRWRVECKTPDTETGWGNATMVWIRLARRKRQDAEVVS